MKKEFSVTIAGKRISSKELENKIKKENTTMKQ